MTKWHLGSIFFRFRALTYAWMFLNSIEAENHHDHDPGCYTSKTCPPANPYPPAPRLCIVEDLCAKLPNLIDYDFLAAACAIALQIKDN